MNKQEAKDEKSKPAAQKPTTGRVVHFVLPGYEQPAPAIVIGVDPEDETKADLLVLLPHGHPSGFLMSRPGVRFDDSGNELENGHTWHWPARV